MLKRLAHLLGVINSESTAAHSFEFAISAEFVEARGYADYSASSA